LVWRFDATPHERSVSAFGQLESPWPVPGSVLVLDGKCWFVAGRSSFLDDGMRIFALDPITGRTLYEETVYSADPATRKMRPETDAGTMVGLLNDILGSDGQNVFLRATLIGPQGGQPRQHLHSTAGFLDSTWFNRTYWRYGTADATGLMVADEDVAFGVEVYTKPGADSVFTPGADAYYLWRCSVDDTVKKAQLSRNRRKLPRPKWVARPKVRVEAMVRAAEKLLVAGAPDMVDQDDPHAAWEGRKGGVLVTYDARSGEELARVRLPAPPVWDGMAVAEGNVFLSTKDGVVRCLREADGISSE
jgi:outer membrane protein assembly factor BamB